MSDTLNSLKQIASKQQKIYSPFEEKIETKHEYIPRSKSVKHNTRADEVEKISRKIDKLYKDSNTVMDDVFDDIDIGDQNTNVKSSLISLGRKYARSHEDTGDENEITRAFAPQEIKLNELYNEVSKDIIQIEKDLTEMRMMHTGRNMQRMNELISTKAQFHNTSLSILKEISAVKKAQFDIKTKMNKDKDDSADMSNMSSSIIQSVFGMGHDALLNSVGGRAASSGATVGEAVEYDDNDESLTESDDALTSEFVIGNDNISDGEKFIEYENAGVELVLEEYPDGTKQVHAEDKDGNCVPDYPLPKNIDSLTFDINTRAEVATDQLQRNYKYRKIGY